MSSMSKLDRLPLCTELLQAPKILLSVSSLDGYHKVSLKIMQQIMFVTLFKIIETSQCFKRFCTSSFWTQISPKRIFSK